MSGNFLYLSESQLDRPVYRIFSVTRLFELFDRRQNVLVRPSKWDDPFENFILNARVKAPNGEMGEFGFRHDLYGQCWTLQKASDAMWRIYSPNSEGVRVRSTPRKLREGLARGLAASAHLQAFIGRVRYLRDRSLLEFARSAFLDGLNPKAIAETLLVKRTAFDHEKEVRLIYFALESSTSDLYSYPFDPHEMIDQIMIDPRLAVSDANRLKDEIRLRTSFSGEIRRSLLYAPPEGFVLSIG